MKIDYYIITVEYRNRTVSQMSHHSYECTQEPIFRKDGFILIELTDEKTIYFNNSEIKEIEVDPIFKESDDET